MRGSNAFLYPDVVRNRQQKALFQRLSDLVQLKDQYKRDLTILFQYLNRERKDLVMDCKTMDFDQLHSEVMYHEKLVCAQLIENEL